MSGWQSAKLREVTQSIARGVAPAYTENGGILVVNQRCVRNHQIDLAYARRHDPSKKSFNADRLIRVGDVLVNSTGVGTLGRVAQVRCELPEPTTVDTHVTIVRPTCDLFYPDFFGYMLVAIEAELAEAGEGASGQTELSRTRIGDFEVRYPKSIAEQKRIVAILDEAFDGIVKATANAERNLANARELFEAHLDGVFEQAGENWVEAPLGHFVTVKHGFAFKSEFFVDEGDFVLLTPGNFFERGGYRDRGGKQKFYCGPIPDGFVLSPGSLLVAMTEQAPGLLGSPLIVPFGKRFLHNQRLGLVEPMSGVAWVPELFEHLFNTPKFRAAVHKDGTGIKVRHTSPEKLRSVVVRVPKQLSEQVQLAERLSEMRVRCEALEGFNTQRIALLEDLKSSFLAKAFSGQLTGNEAIAA